MNAMTTTRRPTSWLACHAAGMTSSQAAKVMGLSATTARKWARRNGLKWRLPTDDERAMKAIVASEAARERPQVPKLPTTEEPIRAEDCTRLFRSVVVGVLTDIKIRVGAANGGRTRINLNGVPVQIFSVERERYDAMTYLAARDFQLLCELASVDLIQNQAMNWIDNGSFLNQQAVDRQERMAGKAR